MFGGSKQEEEKEREREKERRVTHQKSPFRPHEVDWMGGKIGDRFSQTLIPQWRIGVSP